MKRKVFYFFLLILLLISYFIIEHQNSLYSQIKSNEATSTSGIVVTGELWENYIGNDPSVGDYIAFRTLSKGGFQGLVLIVTSLDEYVNAINLEGKIMDPYDGNALDALKTYVPITDILDKDSKQAYRELFLNTSEKNITIESTNLKVTSMNLGDYLPVFAKGLLPPGYVSSMEGGLLIVGGRGPILFIDNDNKEIININSNLLELVSSQNYSSTSGSSDTSARMGVRDTFYDIESKNLYISMITKNFNAPSYNCFGIGIFEADASNMKENNILSFDLYYKTKSCMSNVNFQQSGGKIQRHLNGFLFTVGDFDQNNPRLLMDSSNELGKILYIEGGIKKKNFSTGHRNPQGLYANNGLVYSTEHGPKGGDEINLVKEGVFYGWPIYSYGTEYSGEDIYIKPHGDEAMEPIIYFTPSIAIAEIARYSGDEFSEWNENFLVGSLKDQSLYLIKIENIIDVISSTKIPIERRVRDITIDNYGVIWLITDDAMLVKITNEK